MSWILFQLQKKSLQLVHVNFERLGAASGLLLIVVARANKTAIAHSAFAIILRQPLIELLYDRFRFESEMSSDDVLEGFWRVPQISQHLRQKHQMETKLVYARDFTAVFTAIRLTFAESGGKVSEEQHPSQTGATYRYAIEMYLNSKPNPVRSNTALRIGSWIGLILKPGSISKMLVHPQTMNQPGAMWISQLPNLDRAMFPTVIGKPFHPRKSCVRR